jgi:hypothetical protein
LAAVIAVVTRAVGYFRRFCSLLSTYAAASPVAPSVASSLSPQRWRRFKSRSACRLITFSQEVTLLCWLLDGFLVGCVFAFSREITHLCWLLGRIVVFTGEKKLLSPFLGISLSNVSLALLFDLSPRRLETRRGFVTCFAGRLEAFTGEKKWLSWFASASMRRSLGRFLSKYDVSPFFGYSVGRLVAFVQEMAPLCRLFYRSPLRRHMLKEPGSLSRDEATLLLAQPVAWSPLSSSLEQKKPLCLLFCFVASS